MGTCVTKTSHEIHDIIHKNKSIKLLNKSCDDEEISNISQIGLRNELKINTHSLGEVAYDTSTLTEYDHNDTDLLHLSPYHHCWSIGCNKNGAQGNGTRRNVSQLKKMTSLPHNISINSIITGNCGSTYLLCDNNEKLFVWGYNEYGSISMDNEVINVIIKVWNSYNSLSANIIHLLISFIDEITALQHPLKPIYIHNNNIKCLSLGISAFHKFLLLKNNDLYGIGKNGWNQLGIKHDDENRNSYHCVKIEYFQKYGIILAKIACSLTYSTFLTETGYLYSCGKARFGGLGLGKTVSWPDGIKKINGLKTKIADIACGESHTLALNYKEQVLSWGYNNVGQLGHGNNGQRTAVFQPKLIKYLSKNNINIRQIACGDNHNVILDDEGKIYCFGRNYGFECGEGTNICNINRPQLNQTLKDIKTIQIKCGSNHNVVKTKEYEFYLWGINDFNQCLICNQDNFVRIPTKYKSIDGISDWLNYKIIDIYPGWKETRIITANVLRTSYL